MSGFPVAFPTTCLSDFSTLKTKDCQKRESGKVYQWEEKGKDLLSEYGGNTVLSLRSGWRGMSVPRLVLHRLQTDRGHNCELVKNICQKSDMFWSVSKGQPQHVEDLLHWAKPRGRATWRGDWLQESRFARSLGLQGVQGGNWRGNKSGREGTTDKLSVRQGGFDVSGRNVDIT